MMIIDEVKYIIKFLLFFKDPSRLYYEPWELRMFENIECEWPLFFCYMIINACFRNDRERVAAYSEALDEVIFLIFQTKLVLNFKFSKYL
jgi:hypothetical protein